MLARPQVRPHDPAFCPQHPELCTLHPELCTLHPEPCTLKQAMRLLSFLAPTLPPEPEKEAVEEGAEGEQEAQPGGTPYTLYPTPVGSRYTYTLY